MNLRFLVVIRGIREEDKLKIFLCYPSGSGTSQQSSPLASEVAYLVHADMLVFECSVGGVIGQWAVVSTL